MPPLHDFRCKDGHVSEAHVPQGMDAITCQTCGHAATKVFLRAPMAFVQPDICYDSPIDGRPITSMAARREDLARNNCREYDPEMRKDYDRRIAREAAQLEAAVDSTVDEEITKMPVRKKELLQAELAGGADAVPERITAPVKPLKVEIEHG